MRAALFALWAADAVDHAKECVQDLLLVGSGKRGA